MARNPKDAVVSFYHHCRIFKNQDFTNTFEEFVQYFLDGDCKFRLLVCFIYHVGGIFLLIRMYSYAAKKSIWYVLIYGYTDSVFNFLTNTSVSFSLLGLTLQLCIRLNPFKDIHPSISSTFWVNFVQGRTEND